MKREHVIIYPANIIAHRREHESVLDIPTDAKSIVDNILTPGF